jgi:deoxyribonuclease V
MILAFDVAYNDNNIAQAVGIGFQSWEDEQPEVVYKEFIIGLEPYQPGEFYKRELPCIEKILTRMDLSVVTAIVIDGYVFLNDDGKPGLGAHLYEKLGGKIPVIGVAKSSFAGNVKHVEEILRGKSNVPLYISAIGMELHAASLLIRQMSGEYRMPTLLKKLDQLTRH